jgi:hypothetical protein
MSAGLVSQHQQSSFASPVNGAAGDATVVLGNDNATVSTYNSHDADATIHLQSSTAAVFATVPAGTAGRKWLTSDGLRVFYDTGSVWSEIDYLCQTTGGTVAGATTFTDTVTTGSGSGATLAAGSVSVGTDVGFAASHGIVVGNTRIIAFRESGTTFAVATGLSSVQSLTVASGQTLTVSGATVTGLTAASVGSGTFPGVYTITGAVTLSALLTANAGATIASGQTLTVTGATVTGLTAASVGTGTFPGVYTITGAVTLSALLTANAGVTVASGQTLTLNGATLSGTIAGTPTFSGLFTVTAGMTVASSSGVLNVGGMSPANANPHYVALANANAAVGTPSGGGFLYVESGALKFIGTSGTITTVAPP